MQERQKMMIFRKIGGKRKNCKFTWNNEKLETVKTFDYLGHESDSKEIDMIIKRSGL